MAEHLKSASIIEADLRSRLSKAEEELAGAFKGHQVAIIVAIFFVVGFVMGLVV